MRCRTFRRYFGLSTGAGSTRVARKRRLEVRQHASPEQHQAHSSSTIGSRVATSIKREETRPCPAGQRRDVLATYKIEISECASAKYILRVIVITKLSLTIRHCE
jgi:hypothetical protein